jgi:type III pantothenate kinase
MIAPYPADALLAVDIGNTRMGMGVYEGDALREVQRLSTYDEDAWNAPLRSLWGSIAAARRRAVVIASVSPRATTLLAERIEAICDVEPFVVRDDLPLPLDLDLENPAEVGVDRVCSAAAAFDRLRTPCAIASFGTAITVDCVDGRGTFLGGAILPGLEMSCEALHEGTAQLPLIHAGQPAGVFGRNTQTAIANGVVYGAVGALRELVERYATALGEWPQLIATGGDAELIRSHADFIDSVVPDLCLMGVVLAYRKASGQSV